MTTPPALVFLDTETTGLLPEDHIWEVAAVRIDADGRRTTLHRFVEHDLAKAAALPESFRADHADRYRPGDAIPPAQLATELLALFGQPERYQDRAHVVGCVPNFDTERLARILRACGHDVPWHHHLIDVECLAVGYLRGLTAEYDPAVFTLPWDSDALSRAIHVDPPGDGVRHTAMGDVQWAISIYDAVMGLPQ